MCSSKQVSCFSNSGYCVLIKSSYSLHKLRTELILTQNYDQLILKLYTIDYGKPLLFKDNMEYINPREKLFLGKSFSLGKDWKGEGNNSYNVVHAYLLILAEREFYMYLFIA